MEITIPLVAQSTMSRGRDMDFLRDIVLFVEVAKVKNFSKAAATLGMPSSSLSRRIAELEKNIGLKLLNRTTRRTDLTEAGSLYYERCRLIVQEAQLAHEQLGDLSTKPSGLLRVSMSVDFGIFYLAPLLPEFLNQYPDIQLDIDLSARNRDLIAESVDLVIRMGPLPDSGLYARKIAEGNLQLYATPAYLHSAPKLKAPGDLLKHKCIVMKTEYGEPSWRLHQGAEHQDMRFANALSVNNMGMALRLSTLGLGIAALGQAFAQEEIAAGHLVQVLPQWSFSPVSMFAVSTSRLQPAKSRVFIDFLVERLSAK